MEDLWYTLTPNVLQKMIRFGSDSIDQECPKFILEIEDISKFSDRYIMNLVDGSDNNLFGLTSDKFSRIINTKEAIPGKKIIILHYWLIELETTSKSEPDMLNHEYIVVIVDAAVLKLGPTAPINLLNKVSKKTRKIRGIVSSYVEASKIMGDDNNHFLYFRLFDNIDSIGCKIPGELCDRLEPYIRRGVKVEVYHAELRRVHGTERIATHNFELIFNESTIVKIYSPVDHSVMYTNIVGPIEDLLPWRNSTLSQSQASQDQKPTQRLILCDRKCSNGKIAKTIDDLTEVGVCRSWVRGVVKSYVGISGTTRTNSVYTRFHIYDYSSAISCVLWDPLATLTKDILKDGMVVEIKDGNVKILEKRFKVLDHDFDIHVTRYSMLNILANDGTILYQYDTEKKDDEKGKNIDPGLSLLQSKLKCSNGAIPIRIDSLVKVGYCNSWIRGIITRNVGLGMTQQNCQYLRFFLKDVSGFIQCVAWDPVSVPLSRFLEVGMILEVLKVNVNVAKNEIIRGIHQFQLYINTYSSVRLFNSNSKLIYSYKPRS